MKLSKTLLVFVAGVLAGGLIFGLGSRAISQAGAMAPSDLFVMSLNQGRPGLYKQYFDMKDKYKSKYRLSKLARMSNGTEFVVYLGDK